MNKSVAVTTIVIIAIGLVTLIMLLQTCSTSPRELTNTLNIEVFAQCPIVDDSLDFQGEANGFVSHFSTGQPSPLFLNPIVSFTRLDQSGIAELSGLASDSIEIPVEFMNSFRAGVFPEQYTLEDRKMEEDEYLNVTCAEDQNYIRFRHNAIRASACEPLQINYDMNDTIKEFLIDHSMASDYSDHHKKWKNSQLLHSYIEMLIASKMVKANDAIRVIYLKAPKVVVVADRDKDGVADEVDQCPDIKGEKRCEGCVCPPVIDNDKDKDRDGLNDDIDQCPNSFGSQKYKGCPIPDTDGDGLNDEIDQCPSEKGDKSNNGCPLIKKITEKPVLKKNSNEIVWRKGLFSGVMIISDAKGRESAQIPIDGVKSYALKKTDFTSQMRNFPINSNNLDLFKLNFIPNVGSEIDLLETTIELDCSKL
jgi:hypothetical protein